VETEVFERLKFIISKALKKARLSAIRGSTVHPSAKIESGTSFVNSKIGRHSFCGYDCDIHQAHIGAFTSIANGVILGGARHPMEWVGMSPVFYAGRDSVKAKFSEHPLAKQPEVSVGNDVWIGRSAIVLGGVAIGDGAVVGAGSVVTKNVPSYAIVAGNPARIIRYRFEDVVIRELEAIEWWHFPESRLKDLGECFNDVERFLSVVRDS
jgi:acetyltransferase-like isoleucine patch superfamily enzyme